MVKSDKRVIREHADCVIAVHKTTGEMFGGGSTGTNIGYAKIGPLKTSMTNAGVDHKEYRFEQLSFNPIGLPTIITIER